MQSKVMQEAGTEPPDHRTASILYIVRLARLTRGHHTHRSYLGVLLDLDIIMGDCSQAGKNVFPATALLTLALATKILNFDWR